MSAGRWPPGRPRVLVSGAFLANSGDAATALATDLLIREVAPSASILHAAYQSDTLGRHLPGLEFVPSLESLLGSPWAPPAKGWEAAGAELVAGADRVVSGGFFVQACEPFARVAALARAARSGLPVALVGQSIDHFTRAVARRHLQVVMASSPLVIVRDPESIVHAAELGAKDALLGTDLALRLFPHPPPPRERSGVGVVLTDHHPVAARRAEVAAAASFVLRTALESARSERVVLWSTVQGRAEEAREGDGALARLALAALTAAERDRVEFVSGYVPPLEAIERAASCRALVTMRLRPALFAAASGTPFALVLGGQLTGVLAGTSLAACVADPHDRVAIAAAVGRAVSGGGGEDVWGALGPLRLRLAEASRRLGEFLKTG